MESTKISTCLINLRSLSRWRRPQIEAGYRRPILASRPSAAGHPPPPRQRLRKNYRRPAAHPRPYVAPEATVEAITAQLTGGIKTDADLDTNDNRRHYDTVTSRGESTSLMRSMLGVNPFCVHDDAQFSCTFTPLCWMQGGVAMSGCDSMLYSCCVSHTIARRQVGLYNFFFS